MSLPIDTTKVKFLTGHDVIPDVIYETGVQKVTRDGQPVFQVLIVSFPDGGAAEIVKVKVPGEPKGLRPHAPVRITGLEVRTYKLKDGKEGLTYWATAIEPEGAVKQS